MHTTFTVAFTEAESPADSSAARQLFIEYSQWLGFSLAYQNFDDELAMLPGRYARPLGRLLLARIDGALAGCAALRPLEPSVCEMKRLYVRPEFRSHGLGSALAERLISEARAIGYTWMRLDTIAHKMDGAIALYRTLGFREIPPYYPGAPPDTLFFELSL
ncbi:MAG: GNAT family N-acetyltransferase [Candidatus Acidiferrales bacterium]